jgi:hypothetical protein
MKARISFYTTREALSVTARNIIQHFYRNAVQKTTLGKSPKAKN